MWFVLSVTENTILQDLIDDLKYELTGNFERLIVSLMRTAPYHDAKEIKDAIKVRPHCSSLSHSSATCTEGDSTKHLMSCSFPRELEQMRDA